MVLNAHSQGPDHPTEQNKAAAEAGNPVQRILLAEDDNEMRTLLAELLRGAGYEVVECPNGWGLLESLGDYVLPGSEHREVGLVISDIRMPGVSGLDILTGLQHLEDCPPIILITAFGDESTHAKAKKLGAAAMLDKPFDIDDLLAKVAQIFKPQEQTNRPGFSNSTS